MSTRTPSRLVLTVAFTITALLLGIIGAVAAGTGTVAPPPKIAFVTTNANVAPDALTVGPMAGRLGAPLFITNKEVLGESTKNALVGYGANLIIVAGGPNTVTDAVLNEIAAATGLQVKDADTAPSSGIIRVSGEGRDETAVALSTLIAKYNPKFLPTDATAADADLLDGKDSGAFQSRVTGTCGSDKAVATIAADGSVTCRSTYPTTGSITLSSGAGAPQSTATTGMSYGAGYVGRFASSGGSQWLVVDVPLPDGATVTKITSVIRDNAAGSYCFYFYSNDNVLIENVGCSAAAASTSLQSIEYTTPVVVDGTVGYHAYMPIDGAQGVNVLPVRMTFEYTLG